MKEMWKLLPENQIGEFKICHVEIDQEYIKLLLLRDAANGREEYRDLYRDIFFSRFINLISILQKIALLRDTKSKFAIWYFEHFIPNHL